jgi:hypothetical protein
LTGLFYGALPNTPPTLLLDQKSRWKNQEKILLAFTLQGPQAATIFSGLPVKCLGDGSVFFCYFFQAMKIPIYTGTGYTKNFLNG